MPAWWVLQRLNIGIGMFIQTRFWTTLFFISFAQNVYASGSEYDLQMRSHCNIDAISTQVTVYRHSDSESDKYCLKLGKTGIDSMQCSLVDFRKIEDQKNNQIADNLKRLYIAGIQERKATKNPSTKSHGYLIVEVDVSLRVVDPEGLEYYSVKQKTRLEEEGTNRIGRKGNMLLNLWSEVAVVQYGETEGVIYSQAEKIIKAINAQFEFADSYCKKNPN